MKKKNLGEVHHHTHFEHVDISKLVLYFFVLVVGLILVTNIMSTLSAKLMENKYAYGDCLDTCEKQKWQGSKVGVDWSSLYQVIEFDRTPCVRECNGMYLALRNKGGMRE